MDAPFVYATGELSTGGPRGVAFYSPTMTVHTLASEPVELDCERACFRHGGDLPCVCDDETEGGVWQPGC